jgi:hypothetical protein
MRTISFAGMELGVPAAPTSVYKPLDTSASSLLRDRGSPAGRRAVKSSAPVGGVGY